MNILKTIGKILYFFILSGLAMFTVLPALPSAIKNIIIGTNMYNQTGFIHHLAMPYLFLHKKMCKEVFGINPNTSDF